ncbi:MAG: hypothetical protein KAH20_15725 [Methylococcales bacterium]|nr:hypothetical protein [Methylococcales bacterium]
MNTKIWPPGELPEELDDIIYKFICRRFKDEWSINRTDISYEIINNRKNIIVVNKSSIVGYLGIEADGELVNGSIEKGKGLLGIKRLQALIELAVRTKKNNVNLYAFVPVVKTGAAAACFLMGMIVQEPVILKKVNYQKKTIILIKLVFPLKINEALFNSRYHAKQQLKKLDDIQVSLFH